jgi:hypothetical protein
VETGTSVNTFGRTRTARSTSCPTTGAILRLAPGATAPDDRVPRTLRATGCVDAADPLRPAEGLIPYAPSAPFWSDGADKERFMALPEGGRITVGADGDWEFPNGTVLVKNFTVGGRRVETRLFVRHPDGEWRGYTYRWNDAQTDADLLDGSEVRDLGGGLRWYYPSRTQCMECHSAAAGRSLGLESAQLNTALRYPNGRVSNQLDTLDHIGLFAAALPPAPMRPAAYPDPYAPGPDEPRARAYLHSAHCQLLASAPPSRCHRPGWAASAVGAPARSVLQPAGDVSTSRFDTAGAALLTPPRSPAALELAPPTSPRAPPRRRAVHRRLARARPDRRWVRRAHRPLGGHLPGRRGGGHSEVCVQGRVIVRASVEGAEAIRVEIGPAEGNAFVREGAFALSPIGDFPDWSLTPPTHRRALDGLRACVRANAALDGRAREGLAALRDRAWSPSRPVWPWRLLLGLAISLGRMPPISSGVVDAAGVALIDRWVRSLTRCP